MRLYAIDQDVHAVDFGPVEILFYHGRPVALKHYADKVLYVITENVTRDVPFRQSFRTGWTGKVEVTGGQAALEERILEAIQAMPAPA
ncbi:MAG: hypothetical protein KJO11_10600 [Gemmatimonadetes bacterium]|nr:hypothetical protein [Gemmatimonadota bacterium]MBT8404975.1 hypothetical protein [Gemmatimonadota bacterium]NNF37680.1 hypothetical protein [Gemmatimonadota bacterium]NNK63398.1 hypothetical protein [Gemmatimonadota bacterium]